MKKFTLKLRMTCFVLSTISLLGASSSLFANVYQIKEGMEFYQFSNTSQPPNLETLNATDQLFDNLAMRTFSFSGLLSARDAKFVQNFADEYQAWDFQNTKTLNLLAEAPRTNSAQVKMALITTEPLPTGESIQLEGAIPAGAWPDLYQGKGVFSDRNLQQKITVIDPATKNTWLL